MLDTESIIPWPPNYTVKIHRLAKYVKLRYLPLTGLHITVPPRFNLKKIPLILEENKDWILKKIHLRHDIKSQSYDLPHTFILPTFNETWAIHYLSSQVKLQIVHRPHQEIVLMGNIHKKDACIKLLNEWVRFHFNDRLITQLNELSHAINLSYNNVRIRDQKTLWGSCTTHKTISLNYKLIFLPNELARYVMIHELCHTVHLNHSSDFWRLVSQFDPLWKEHRYELRKADQFIPPWIL